MTHIEKLENIAVSVMRELKMETMDWQAARDVEEFSQTWEPKIAKMLGKKDGNKEGRYVFPDGILGEIFAAGLGSLHSPIQARGWVYSTSFTAVWDSHPILWKGSDGRQLLERMAAAVLVAAIYDLLRPMAPVEPVRVEEFATE